MNPHADIGAAINKACAELPHGWNIKLELENGYCGVRLTDDGNCDIELPGRTGEIDWMVEQEGDVGQAIGNAVAHAIALHAEDEAKRGKAG